MKNFKTTFLIFFLTSISFAQTEYRTKQGMFYKIGDTIHIGKPMSIGANMVMKTGSHWKTIYKMNGSNSNNANLNDKKAVISKIEEVDDVTRFTFRIFSTNFYVNIDDAILKGEVLDERLMNVDNKNSQDKYDKLKKAKELFDSGVLTTEEFEAEKKKILALEK